MSELSLTLGSKLSFREINEFVEHIVEGLKTGPSRLVIDMSSCIYLNSIMLSGLIRAKKQCENYAIPLVLRHVSASTLTLFDTTNVTPLFTIEEPLKREPFSHDLHIQWDVMQPHIGVCKLRGSLDTPTGCNQFRNSYEKQMLEHTTIIVDFSQVDHVGSPGVTECFRLRGMIQEKNGQLFVVSNSESLDSMWRMMHLGNLIPKYDTLEQALESIDISR